MGGGVNIEHCIRAELVRAVWTRSRVTGRRYGAERAAGSPTLNYWDAWTLSTFE